MSKYFIFVSFLLLFNACIKDDFIDDLVEAKLRISNPIDSLELNKSFQFEAIYLNNIGEQDSAFVQWESSDAAIIEIDNQGLALAKNIGTAAIIATTELESQFKSDTLLVSVGNSTVVTTQEASGMIETTSSYILEGSFEVLEEQGGIRIEIGSDYRASSSLPGLYLYLSNNRNSIAGALEVSKVAVYNGAHNYVIPNVSIADYSHLLYFCKPFNVKVGDGEIK